MRKKLLTLRQADRRRPALAQAAPAAMVPRPAESTAGKPLSGLAQIAFVMLMATLGTGLFGLAQLRPDAADRAAADEFDRKMLIALEQDRAAQRAEAIDRAWTRITFPAPGNSGKREALELLAAQGVALRGIDLSCAPPCTAPAYLEGLRLTPPADAPPVDLVGARLDGAVLWSAQLRRANLYGASLPRADLYDADLRKADLSNATLERANLHEAHLQGAVLSGANLQGAKISGTDFTGATGLATANFAGVWAWADRPPKGLPGTVAVTLCQYRQTADAFSRPVPCLAPDQTFN